jgi:hypothetical protein
MTAGAPDDDTPEPRPGAWAAAFASLKSEPINDALARDVLGDVIPPPGYKPSIEKIQDAVAAHYGLSVAERWGSRRQLARSARARPSAWRLGARGGGEEEQAGAAEEAARGS